MLLTACEKGLVDGVADVAPTGQAANSVLQVRTRSGGSLLFVLGTKAGEKAQLTIMLSDNLVASHGMNAGQMVREAAKLIQGGGGGQPHFAQAGGKNADGLSAAVDKVIELAKL
jgi:alanyl-tRNA synthetase